MRCESEFRIGRNGFAPAAPHAIRRIEKPSNSNNVHTEHRTPNDPAHPHAGVAKQAALCRFETEAGGPLWDGSILQSAFAAQVLAQGMKMAASDMPSAIAMYRGHHGSPLSLVFDADI
jgi:tRNA G26 N,N-dimethylase Trm1